MQTLFIASADGTQIAYDINGSGPALLLLHGGSGSRRDWHKRGYVERLRHDFTVITVDARGHGESAMPTDESAYAIDKLCQDILTVADACRIEQFAIWGFSYGGNIGRFLAARSERVQKMIIIGIPFGPAASEGFRQFIADYKEKWAPLVSEQREDTLNINALAERDREHLQRGDVAVRMAWLGALPTWGGVEPTEMRCPTLWLVGSENETAMKSVQKYRGQLANTEVVLRIVDGLDHGGEFAEIDAVFPLLLDFTR